MTDLSPDRPVEATPERAESAPRSDGFFRRAARWTVLFALVLLIAAGWAATSWLADQAPRIDRLAELTPDCPSRLYGSPAELSPGQSLSVEELERLLHDARYLPTAADPARGTYRLTETEEGANVEVALRPFPVPLANGFAGGGKAEIVISGDTLETLSWQGEARELPLALDPPRLASFHDDSLKECRPIEVDALPPHLTQAVMAAEDGAFMDHPGFSVAGIARAAVVNLRAGQIRQGGSTITQQLVKNVYLDPSRSLERKLREVGLALLADRRYEKTEILEAYLNRVYWGRSGSVQLVGIAAAAEAFFNRDPEELTLEQSALLAGMISSPGNFDPRRSPEEAKARRDWVLGRMAELGWIDRGTWSRARTTPIDVRKDPFERNRVGHFARYAALEAAERYGIELAGTGHRLLATVRLDEQRAAVRALDRQLEELAPEAGLEGALVSVRPADGAILAYAGGRDFQTSPYDRARQARRQVGSLYKPFVYAAAFRHDVTLPHHLVADAPVTVRVGDESWSPRNHKRDFRGMITVREALEKSLNVPAVRVAMATGMKNVASTAQALGVPPKSRYPSMALGASEFSPFEMAGAFATLASAGRRPEVHGLAAVYDRRGVAVDGREPARPARAIEPATAHLVNSVLRGVVDRGTGWRLRSLGFEDPIAGKTGTSNDTRDAWFAGYSPDRATVVWVGYDDNRPTGLLGGRAALPVFAAFAQAVRPKTGFAAFDPEPPGFEPVKIDVESGFLATEHCPRTHQEILPVDRIPTETCPWHSFPDDLFPTPELDPKFAGGVVVARSTEDRETAEPARAIITNVVEPRASSAPR